AFRWPAAAAAAAPRATAGDTATDPRPAEGKSLPADVRARIDAGRFARAASRTERLARARARIAGARALPLPPVPGRGYDVLDYSILVHLPLDHTGSLTDCLCRLAFQVVGGPLDTLVLDERGLAVDSVVVAGGLHPFHLAAEQLVVAMRAQPADPIPQD